MLISARKSLKNNLKNIEKNPCESEMQYIVFSVVNHKVWRLWGFTITC